MTRSEFEQEARRVFKAFGRDSRKKLEIEHKIITNQPKGSGRVDPSAIDALYIEDDGDDFCLLLSLWTTPTEQSFGILLRTRRDENGLRGFVRFIHKPSGQSLSRSFPNVVCPPEYTLVLLRGLFYLGYDIDPLCDAEGVTITAHEKMEWELQRQEGQQIPKLSREKG